VGLTPTCAQNIDVTKSPLAHALLAGRRTRRRSAVATHFPALPAELLTHLFELFPPRALDLIVSYTATSSSGSPRHGHLHLSDLRLGPAEDYDGALAAVLGRAAGLAGGLYAESQRERLAILSAYRRSELAGSEMPVAVAYEVAQAVQADFADVYVWSSADSQSSFR
jgi:hypothetical protein